MTIGPNLPICTVSSTGQSREDYDEAARVKARIDETLQLPPVSWGGVQRGSTYGGFAPQVD